MEQGTEFEEFEEFEKHALEVVRKAEETALEAGRRWAASAGELVPAELSVLRDMVDGVFDFTEEVLKLQREFVHEMIRAVREPIARAAKSIPRATGKSIPRAAGKPATTPRKVTTRPVHRAS